MSETSTTIGIIVGSIREGRKGIAVGEWAYEQATTHLASARPQGDDSAQRREVGAQLIDLAAFDLPLLTDETVPGGANRQYDSDNRTRWGEAIDACDAYIFVTAEYNHGVPGAFKNAYDSIGPEWQGKPVGFVSYGSVAGVRAVEQWRQIVATFAMTDVTSQVSLSIFEEFDEHREFQPNSRRNDELTALVDELVSHLG